MRRKIKKRGLSPVIATVLLIAMIVVIGLIVFLWLNGMVKETITKFDGQNIEIACDQVEFTASYSENMLSISNNGNVPIFGMKIKTFKEGSYETKDLSAISDYWPNNGLNQGEAFSSEDLSQDIGSISKMILTSVLMGNSEKGERTYKCDEQRHGYEMTI